MLFEYVRNIQRPLNPFPPTTFGLAKRVQENIFGPAHMGLSNVANHLNQAVTQAVNITHSRQLGHYNIVDAHSQLIK